MLQPPLCEFTVTFSQQSENCVVKEVLFDPGAIQSASHMIYCLQKFGYTFTENGVEPPA